MQGANHLTLHNASYLNSPHRVIAQASYALNYNERHAINISLFYSGERTGNYSFLYANDMNNDGYIYDLMYIPRTKDELNFKDMTVGTKTFTASEQREAFWTFVNQDPYLSKHKGEYAETSSAYLPWLNRFDMRLMREFRFKAGKSTNSLQLCLDILNIGNLLNSSWGVTKVAKVNQLLSLQERNAAGEPVYTMATMKEDGETVLPVESFMPSRVSASCWQIQVGVRYTFN